MFGAFSVNRPGTKKKKKLGCKRVEWAEDGGGDGLQTGNKTSWQLRIVSEKIFVHIAPRRAAPVFSSHSFARLCNNRKKRQKHLTLQIIQPITVCCINIYPVNFKLLSKFADFNQITAFPLTISNKEILCCASICPLHIRRRPENRDRVNPSGLHFVIRFQLCFLPL